METITIYLVKCLIPKKPKSYGSYAHRLHKKYYVYNSANDEKAVRKVARIVKKDFSNDQIRKTMEAWRTENNRRRRPYLRSQDLIFFTFECKEVKAFRGVIPVC